MSRPLDPGVLNLEWAGQLLSRLVAMGLEELQIAPGSRSTPLVLAASGMLGLRTRVHLDERSAAFFALGYGRRRGVPSAVVTTSGTAVANLLPAVVEASTSRRPPAPSHGRSPAVSEGKGREPDHPPAGDLLLLPPARTGSAPPRRG